jgi:hypothetical protein
MYRGYYEEGDRCPECGNGKLCYPPVENCTCHINPPCSACTDRNLVCEKCGYEVEEPVYQDIPVAPGLSMREYKPKPLNNTRIDYRTKAHTASTMICEGVYPAGTSMEAVREVVKGTFGGNF